MPRFHVTFKEAPAGGQAGRTAFKWSGEAAGEMAAATEASLDMDAAWQALTLSHPGLAIGMAPHLRGRPEVGSAGSDSSGERLWEVGSAMSRAVAISPEEPAPRLAAEDARSLIRDLMACDPAVRTAIREDHSPRLRLARATQGTEPEDMSYDAEAAWSRGNHLYRSPTGPVILRAALLVLCRTERGQTDPMAANWQDGRRLTLCEEIACPASAAARAAVAASLEHSSRAASGRIGRFLRRLGEPGLAAEVAALAEGGA